MALPWIIGGLAVATVAYLASDDDSSSSSSYSDREEREREAREEAKKEKNREIREEISEYKEIQESEIEKKYGASIFFDNQEELKVLMAEMEGRTEYENIEKASKVTIFHQDKNKEEKIDDLSNEINELEEALKELEVIRNETL